MKLTIYFETEKAYRYMLKEILPRLDTSHASCINYYMVTFPFIESVDLVPFINTYSLVINEKVSILMLHIKKVEIF